MVMVMSGKGAIVTGLLGPLNGFLPAQVAARFCRPAIVDLVPYCVLREVPDLRI